MSLAAQMCRDGHGFLRNVASLEGLFAALLKESGAEVERSALIGKIFDTKI